MTFSELGLIKPLLRAVEETGYTQPSPIQQKAIPPVLAGRDILACAQTGTGKTAAFALPILQLLSSQKTTGKKVIRSLILTPTRELALQIQENFCAYGKHLPLRSVVIFGGVGQAPQVAQLRQGADILVATPGRLLDLIGQGYIKLQDIEIFVLDEADRMLDMGFVHDVKRVIKYLPTKMQTLLFSATMPKEIVALADKLLHQPVKVFVTPPATTVEKIEQSIYRVDKANKRHLLAHLLRGSHISSALVFTRTKHGADRVVRELKREGIPALAIHGSKSQTARQDALSRFKDGKIGVLVATDIAARGLDINELSHVFNYDLPNIPDTYVHRIGRTGRAGHNGIAISFSTVDELPYLADIERLIGFKIPEVQEHPWPMEILEAGLKPVTSSTANTAKSAPVKKQPERKNPSLPSGNKTNRQQTPAATASQPVTAKTNSPKKTNPPTTTAGAIPPNQQKQATVAKKNNHIQKGGFRQGASSVNPYDNRTGGDAIVTRRPVWSSHTPQEEPAQLKGDDDMSRNNKRRRSGKSRSDKPAPQRVEEPPVKKIPEIKKDDRGIFNFTEEELAEDTALRLISTRSNGPENKYASFEAYLKDH